MAPSGARVAIVALPPRAPRAVRARLDLRNASSNILNIDFLAAQLVGYCAPPSAMPSPGGGKIFETTSRGCSPISPGLGACALLFLFVL